MDVPSTRATLLFRLREAEDPGVWTEFYDRYHELIVAFARRWGLQPSDCDDVLQDAMAKLLRSMQGFTYDPAKGRFRGYLKTVVSSIVVSRLRQKPRDDRVGPLVVDPPSEESLDEAWETEWRRHHVRLAMRHVRHEVSERDLAAFESYAVAGHSVHETAERLQMSADQVYQAKSRILRRIADHIDRQLADEGERS